jgi:hypothetical protein
VEDVMLFVPLGTRVVPDQSMASISKPWNQVLLNVAGFPPKA